MCDKIDINSPEEFEYFLETASKEELYVLREDILNGSAFSDDDDEEEWVVANPT